MTWSRASADTTPQKSRTDITDAYGGGPFQRQALFCGQLAGFVFFSHHLALPLMARAVDHWCSPPPEYANLTTAEWKNVGIPIDPDGHHSRCTRYNPPLDLEATNRTEERCASWSYDTQTRNASILSEWDLVCEQAWLVSFQNAVFMGGSLMLTPILAQTADWTGRHQVVIVAVIVVLVTGFMALFASTQTSFTLLRFLLAGAAGGVRLVSMVLLFELSVPEHRTYYCTALHVGTILAQMFVSALRDLSLTRRQVQASLMLPTYLLACFFYVSKESPRWLLAVGKLSETESLVRWASRLNGMQPPVARQHWRRVRSLRRSPCSNRTSFLDVFFSRALYGRTIVMSICWASLQLSTFELYHALQRAASEWTVLLIGLLQPLALVGSYSLLTRWGRRPVFSCSLFAQGAVAIALGFSGSLEYRALGNALVVSANCLATLTSITSYLYSMELFPTALRCTGVAVVHVLGRLGGVVVANVIHFGLEEREYGVVGITGVVSLVSGWLACRLPETQGLVLAETLVGMEAEVQAMRLLDTGSPGRAHGTQLSTMGLRVCVPLTVSNSP